MPRKEEFEVFTFDELSAKAKKRAIEDFRNDPELTWDDTDSDMLTETFEQDLKDHYGLGDLKVGWSLSCCQGDGVCFWGSVTVHEFLEREKEEKRFPRILKLAEDGNISVKITHTDRYCHWNSMGVEIQDYVDDWDLLPEDLKRKVQEWQRATDFVLRDWRIKKEHIEAENYSPIREWERAVEEFKRKTSQGPREWTPRGPGPRPEPLHNPLPSEPKIVEPDWLLEAQEKMKEERKLYDKELKDFEEWFEERIQDISKEMEKAGYDEMDYHRKDEYITEILENRDWEYLKTGERWER